MTDSLSDAEKKEAERIAKWRAGRKAVASTAKSERIQKAEGEKAQRVSSATEAGKRPKAINYDERPTQTATLLPDANALTEIRRSLRREQRWRRFVAFMQALVFVIAPTVATAWYVTFVAVPLFEARSVVTIATPGGQQDAGLPGMLGAMVPQANMSEAFMAKEFINSMEMMQLLEQEEGLLSYYGSPEMDPLQRLRDVPALQIGASTYYRHYIQTSINIQTGLLTLYVDARTPEDAKRFSMAILKHAEAQIRALSRALFQEQIQENEGAVSRARNALEDARGNLIKLQISSGYVNPHASIAEVYTAIATLESELLGLQGQIDNTALAGYEDSRQMEQLVETKLVLENRIAQQRLRLTSANQGKSLNEVLADYDFLILQQEIAEQTWATALAALGTARNAAALGLSQFQVVVPPNTSLVASQPNRIKTTLLVFLVCFSLFGAYKVFRPKVN